MTGRAMGLVVGPALAAALLAACGSTAGSAGPVATVPPGGALIVAVDQRFESTAVSVPVAVSFPLVLDNRDAAPHNVTIVDGHGKPLFVGEVFGGPAARTYDVPMLAAGTYAFRCDVHPTMTGELVAGTAVTR